MKERTILKDNTRQPMKHLISSIAIALILITGSGCAANSTAPNFCMVYEPVYNTGEIKEPQRTSVEINNAIYMEMC